MVHKNLNVLLHFYFPFHLTKHTSYVNALLHENGNEFQFFFIFVPVVAVVILVVVVVVVAVVILVVVAVELPQLLQLPISFSSFYLFS